MMAQTFQRSSSNRWNAKSTEGTPISCWLTPCSVVSTEATSTFPASSAGLNVGSSQTLILAPGRCSLQLYDSGMDKPVRLIYQLRSRYRSVLTSASYSKNATHLWWMPRSEYLLDYDADTRFSSLSILAPRHSTRRWTMQLSRGRRCSDASSGPWKCPSERFCDHGHRDNIMKRWALFRWKNYATGRVMEILVHTMLGKQGGGELFILTFYFRFEA